MTSIIRTGERIVTEAISVAAQYVNEKSREARKKRGESTAFEIESEFYDTKEGSIVSADSVNEQKNSEYLNQNGLYEISQQGLFQAKNELNKKVFDLEQTQKVINSKKNQKEQILKLKEELSQKAASRLKETSPGLQGLSSAVNALAIITKQLEGYEKTCAQLDFDLGIHARNEKQQMAEVQNVIEVMLKRVQEKKALKEKLEQEVEETNAIINAAREKLSVGESS